MSGLLTQEGRWLGFKTNTEKRASISLHTEIRDLCHAAGIALSAVGRVMYVAGPGFYTGLRLAYGMSDILRIEGKRAISFYNYEIPRLLGHTQYTWITKAYRGEVFVYQHVDGKGEISLWDQSRFMGQDFPGKIFIHHPHAIDDALREKLKNAISTQPMLETEMESIFNEVMKEAVDKPLYYFRPPEEEFKPSV